MRVYNHLSIDSANKASPNHESGESGWAGSIYVAGSTDSTDFLTESPYQASYQGGDRDAFVTKFEAETSQPVVTTVSAASFAAGIALAPESIASGFVQGLVSDDRGGHHSPAAYHAGGCHSQSEG